MRNGNFLLANSPPPPEKVLCVHNICKRFIYPSPPPPPASGMKTAC